MKDNCPYSCNLCNTLLEPWTPPGATSESANYATYGSQLEMGVVIHTGVPQKLDFSDSHIRKYRPSMSTPSYQDEDEYNSKRIQDVLEYQDRYLEAFYEDLDYDDESGYHSAIDTDAENLPMGIEMPLIETCINRHPFCANWAVKGICESKPTAMLDTCAPVCQRK